MCIKAMTRSSGYDGKRKSSLGLLFGPDGKNLNQRLLSWHAHVPTVSKVTFRSTVKTSNQVGHCVQNLHAIVVVIVHYCDLWGTDGDGQKSH